MAGALASDNTVLVVEDDEKVRETIREDLRRQGLTVLCAASGVEALLLAARHRGPIHLLLIDPIMPPGLASGELSRAMRRQRPGLRVLNLEKPFGSAALIKAVFQALDLPPPRPRRRRSKRCILMLVPEADLRGQVARMLRDEDYLVLEAANIGEALCIGEWHVGGISLLLADAEAFVGLPAELPERLMQARPRMRILCASACGLPDVPLPERVRLALEQWGMQATGGG